MSNIVNSLEAVLRNKEYFEVDKFNSNIKRFVFEDYCLNFNKEIMFKSNKCSLIKIDVDYNSSVETNFSIFLNNVCVFNIVNKSTFNKSKILYLDDDNTLKIVANLYSYNNFKIVLSLIGDIVLPCKKLINAKYFYDRIYFLKDSLLSQSMYIDDIKNNIFNNNNYSNVKIQDHNMGEINSQNNVLIHSYIYVEDNMLKLTDDKNIVELGSDYQSACLVLSSDVDYFYKALIANKGKLCLKVFNLNFELVSEQYLDCLDYLNLKELKSISSNISLNYFWAKSQDGFWYLLGVNDFGGIIYDRQYVMCDDIYSYFYDGYHYVLELNQYGLIVNKFDSIDLVKNVGRFEYSNVDNAFVYNGTLYLLIGDIIQEVKL